MTGPVTAPVRQLDIEGPAAPPRSNGELVFAAPWEGRAFGLVMALTDAGVLSYDEFRDRLIAQISRWEAEHPDGAGYSYYRCWLEALEQVLDGRSLVSTVEVTARAAALAARPTGHDHAHEHGPEGHDS